MKHFYSIAESVYNHSIANGGATFNDTGIVFFNQGYSVSIEKFGEKIILKDYDSQSIIKKIAFYMVKNNLYKFSIWNLYNPIKKYYGTWLNQGILYLDISLFTLNESRAIEIGKDNNQAEYYSFKDMKSIPIERTKE